MSGLRHPVVLLCSRCMACAEIADNPAARRWVQIVTRLGTLDVCPCCARGVLAYLSETPPREGASR